MAFGDESHFLKKPRKRPNRYNFLQFAFPIFVQDSLSSGSVYAACKHVGRIDSDPKLMKGKI
jgi:hypothetical protein